MRPLPWLSPTRFLAGFEHGGRAPAGASAVTFKNVLGGRHARSQIIGPSEVKFLWRSALAAMPGDRVAAQQAWLPVADQSAPLWIHIRSDACRISVSPRNFGRTDRASSNPDFQWNCRK
jgi:hypothetical protein